ncbi:MAG: CotH kinase family protein [Phaeodactylibacter sp.]|nr:CotH kinase family protein [Phaeodactylibacter sp.]MCB9264170.1 CotH kinase family protein [Lewinellaceae bacterium]MCB9286790.1 CotH kinase family protein [Lewinellaceae bacterium]
MRVKGLRNNSRLAESLRQVVRQRKRMPLWMIALLGIGVLAMSFFGVFNYGLYLYQSGQTQHFVPVVKDLSRLDFSFIRNYTQGRMAELDEVKIDIKFKHLLRIQYLREQAMQEKYINPAFKEEEFPAKLTYNGKVHNVKIALTGMVSRTHVGNPNKWSFEVKVKGDDTIEGMKRFAMLVPTARGYMTDWLAFRLMDELGIIGMRVNFVDVSINGKSGGVFYMEERFDKYMIENNRMREGIIFKLEKQVDPYRESKLMASDGTRAQLLLIKRMWQDVTAGDLPAENFFDMEKMAKLFVISDLMNNKHPLNKINLRFYFNPITGLAEPIAREFEDLSKREPGSMKMFMEKPDKYTRHYWLEQESIIGLIYNNEVFKRHYIREARTVARKEFLDNFFSKYDEEMKAILHKVYRTLPFYNFPGDVLYANQEYMHAVLFPKEKELLAHFRKQEGSQLSIHLQNQQDLPVEVSWLSAGDARFYPEKPIVIDSRAREGADQLNLYQFSIPDGFDWNDGLLSELKAHYNFLGLEPGEKSIPVLPAENAYALSPAEKLMERTANYSSFSFIRELDGGQTLSVLPGSWTLRETLVIPKGKLLRLEAGANINLEAGGRIISYSPVISLGREEAPVIFRSPDGAGTGFSVIGAGGRSSLSYTRFEGLSSPEEGGRPWGGAVTFYESAVTIYGCTFSGNQRGEEFLSIVRADFSIENSKFMDVKGNAFAGYFCSGEASHTDFINVEKNGITLAGAEVELTNIFLGRIGGEGIRAGEDTELEARWVDIRNAEVGVAGKGASRLMLADARLMKSRTGIRLEQEQTGYKEAYASLSKVNIEGAQTPYALGQNSRLMVDGKVYGE